MSLRIFSAFAVLAIVAVAASLAFASPLDMTRDRIDTEFARFKALFGKAYASPEIEAQRRATFAQNLAQLDKLQAQHPDEYGLTQFMDWTVAERKRILLRAPELPGVNRSDFVSKHAPPQSVLDQRDPLKAAATPAYYWSAYRTGVKNQNQCGSCWAFTISALAEARFVRGKVIQFPNTNPYSISPQQLVSCYARNCEGQYIDDAANWLVNRYTYLLSSWPYASGAGSVPACKTATNAWRPTWVQVLPLNRANISTTVYQREAVSIVIGVCADFYDYSPSSSRIYSCRCATSSYDGYHAMTIVGYNNSASGFYWIVKNSWDTTWGRSGYLYIADGTCSMYNAGRTFVTLW